MDTAPSNGRSTRTRRRRSRWTRIVGIAVAVLALLVLGSGVALTLVANSFANSGRIARNVTIEQVPVAGLTTTEAVEAVHREWVSRLPEELELIHPAGALTVHQKDLGARLLVDRAVADAYRVGRTGSLLDKLSTQLRLRHHPVAIEVLCEVDERAVDAALADIAVQVNKPPRNAEVDVSDDDEVEIVPHTNGLVVDLQGSKQALIDALRRPDVREVSLVVDEQEPEVTADDLSHLEVVLSSYTTQFSTGQVDRSHNLRLAAQAINKTVVMPGEVFSLNDTVGERTPERGYRKAPIFRDGGEIFEDYGGGLCQVSSTTYNAALLANMSIVERSRHNRIVTYVPLGRDAMVHYGNVDMRWRNSLAHPVLLVARVEGESLTVKLIGSRSDKVEVRIERSNVGTTPAGEKEIKDPDLEEGKRVIEKKGWGGGHASVRRMVRNGDRWETNLSYSDSYPASPTVVRVGQKKKDEPKPPAADKPAIPRVPEGAEADSPDQPAAEARRRDR